MRSHQSGDKFSVAKIVRDKSSLLRSETLKGSADAVKEIAKANDAVNSLLAVFDDDNDPSLDSLLKEVFRSGLFQIHDSLIPIAERLAQEEGTLEENTEDIDKDEVIEAWEKALKSTFSQFEEYVKYISDQSRFGTHQGVKGLEFPRVMVILDDDEARGFLFSYEKLLGAKEPSDTDIKNAGIGKDTSIDRTRRLFYVTCSRAEESLAIVAYTENPAQVKKFALDQGWFEAHEIITIADVQ